MPWLIIGGFVNPYWFSQLAHPYWMLRATRMQDKVARRRLYRRIERIKDRLIAEGVSAVQIHCVCRVLVNLANPRARAKALLFCPGDRLPRTDRSPCEDRTGEAGP